ncbi:MAG TPA: tetratricopeptide repeat protein [Acidobacteriota bacterium]|nr:tetratricopeptide repeat protein [Acidobacteriota bacterium]HNB73345.1 tetratricopeptide repeat protein [Acidobacteriota bacterium]HNG94559.1 tetratricopeptide repeat protein [Acidobacteriota bacterium]HNH82074.1 tetratricopeptide repeat protein [Acidobacteriota bacterium]
MVDRLKEAFSQAGISFHEIALPVRQPIVQVIDELVKQLVVLEPGIVSISGFATAYEPERPLGEVVRIFNFNRENLAQPHLRSIWWVTREFSTRLLVDAPDLHSWFLVRLELTEQVVDLIENKPLLLSGEHSAVSVELARKQSAYLAERFETALKQDAPFVDLTQLAVDSIKALLFANLEQEARELSQDFIGKLLPLIPDDLNDLSGNPFEQTQILAQLANLYRSHYRNQEAELFYQKALSIAESQLKPEDPITTNILNDLASLFISEARYEEATFLYQQALDIYKHQFGPDHPTIGTSLNNLAVVFHHQRRFNEAQLQYQQALIICEHYFGPHSIETTIILSNLAILFTAQGMFHQAEPLFARAYSPLTSKLGKDHPYTKLVKRNYLSLLRQMGRTEELD